MYIYNLYLFIIYVYIIYIYIIYIYVIAGKTNKLIYCSPVEKPRK